MHPIPSKFTIKHEGKGRSCVKLGFKAKRPFLLSIERTLTYQLFLRQKISVAMGKIFFSCKKKVKKLLTNFFILNGPAVKVQSMLNTPCQKIIVDPER
jgi:hypothetical protein